MQVGISLPQRVPLAIDDGGASRPIHRLAMAAEQAGYSSLWVSDRLLEPDADGCRRRHGQDGDRVERTAASVDDLAGLLLGFEHAW